MDKKIGEFNVRKFFLVSTIVNAVQIPLILILVWYKKDNGTVELEDYILYIVAIMIILNGIVAIFSYYKLIAKKGEKSLLECMHYLEDFNKKLREQRHDYLNHLQVVYTLLELEEYSEAREYIEPVYKDIIKVSRALKTSKPAVNALLQAKLQMAEENGIDFEMQINTKLHNLNIEAWEFCKILGNIIDNSVYAVNESNKECKEICLIIFQNFNELCIEIINNGPKIRDNMIHEIFKEGVTTKDKKGDGMGLFIVKSLVKKYGGDIKLDSTEDKTTFTISFKL